MLAPRIKAFDSKVAADGAWQKIANYSALSVHVEGLEGDVWVEVSNDPDADPTYVGGSPPVSPPEGCDITGNLISGGTPPAQVEMMSIAYSRDGTQVMVSPSCLAWNYLRVRKTGGGSVETVAWLFGQVIA